MNIDRLRGHETNRGSDPHALLAFLKNFAGAAKLMHMYLRELEHDKTLMAQAIRQYTVSIISCLETYYRDLYVAIFATYPDFVQKLPAEQAKVFRNRRASLPSDVSEATLASGLARFQNLDDIDEALSGVFAPIRYVEALGQTQFTCMIPSRSEKTALFKFWPDWEKEFSQIFDQRHNFVHDANAPALITGKDMAKMEATALIVPQLTNILIAQKMALATSIITTGLGVPAILIVEDVIADDWSLAP